VCAPSARPTARAPSARPTACAPNARPNAGTLRPVTPPPPPRPVLAIGGPTATGKSALALALAERIGGEIVNADALQVYRGFDIGTAKPTPEERRRVPHHLLDILDPHERYSAGEFARRAHEAIGGVAARGRVPIVVGGSGLYWRALFTGLAPVPPGDPEVRRLLRARLDREGLAPLAGELARRDPETAARLGAGDRQRVLRALEVALVSGRPLSAWIARQTFGTQSIASIRVGLTLARGILYDRIRGRVARMVEHGWVAEVRELMAGGLDPGLPAFQAIGYRQLVRCVRGEWELGTAIEETVRATRRFAKRQETWFRKEPDVTWFPVEELDRLLPQVLEHFQRNGLGEGP
jgi:tRNA dimethylallyltransferase